MRPGCLPGRARQTAAFTWATPGGSALTLVEGDTRRIHNL